MTRRISHVHIGLSLVALSVMTAAAVAGNLNPPPGPITSTMKPLNEVEPRVVVNAVNTPGDADSVYKITQPGSYYLIGNVAGVAGKAGIEIAADNVTLDLRGFSLIGVPGSLDGIAVPAPQTALAIDNGTARGWGVAGVTALNASNSQLSRLRAVSNADGLDAGVGSVIIDCTAENNAPWDGITGDTAATIQHCSSTGNGRYGIIGTSRVTVSNSAVHGNGDDGIAVGYGSTVTACSASGNGMLVAAVARQGGKDLRPMSSATAGKQAAAAHFGPVGVSDGIFAYDDCTVTGCTAVENANNGIEVDEGSVVIGCTAGFNAVDGIQGRDRTQIRNCTCAHNNDDGIEVNYDCLVAGNECTENDFDSSGVGAGIHVTALRNRIDSNHVTLNIQGIWVIAAPNAVITNTASGNFLVNYLVAPGNLFGPLVTAATIGANTNPGANYDY